MTQETDVKHFYLQVQGVSQTNAHSHKEQLRSKRGLFSLKLFPRSVRSRTTIDIDSVS